LSKRSKARVEKEVRVQNLEETRDIFYSLGFKKVMIVEKQRRTYTLDDISACIDTIDGLGCFLEIEVMDTDLERGETRLMELLKEWDYDSFETRSYLELLMDGQ
jgi:predicted adenylyl cyclase CyaB